MAKINIKKLLKSDNNHPLYDFEYDNRRIITNGYVLIDTAINSAIDNEINAAKIETRKPLASRECEIISLINSFDDFSNMEYQLAYMSPVSIENEGVIRKLFFSVEGNRHRGVDEKYVAAFSGVKNLKVYIPKEFRQPLMFIAEEIEKAETKIYIMPMIINVTQAEKDMKKLLEDWGD